MADATRKTEDCKRRTYEGWRRAAANWPYEDISASSSCRSFNASNAEPQLKRKPSKEARSRTEFKSARKSAVTSELTIEDITGREDIAYDADVDVQYPDEYDEPNTDEEKITELKPDISKRHDSSLVARFERLLREDNARHNTFPRSKDEAERRRTVPLKRTHSQSSVVSSDPDTNETIEASGTLRPSKHYRRKRRTLHLQQDNPTQPEKVKNLDSSTLQDAMEVD